MRAPLVAIAFLMLTLQAWSQNGQTVTIAQGDTITLTAHSSGALSFVWFHNNEVILNQHERDLDVSTAGTYTVVALGHGCDSDLSEPVHVILGDPDPGQPIEPVVDLQIHNQPDQPKAMIGQPINYQIAARNHSETDATQVVVIISLAREVIFDQLVGMYQGSAEYNRSNHQIVWTIPTLPAGGSLTLNMTVLADAKGTATQIATIASFEPDTHPSDNRHDSDVEIVALKIPNVFTPNGDGINDTFEIVGSDLLGRCDLSIFTPEGQEVYRNRNYRNDWNGGGLNDGVYFYILEVEYAHGRQQVFKGYVMIIR